jgi:pimeloyl-ACP methyl ester carboxylesterase
MPAPLTLPRVSWGDPSAARHALLVHGLGSNGPLMWRFGTALADAGWCATAVDLRGHGVAPRSLDYTLDAYAADLAVTRPVSGGSWDLVVGHSLGGSATTLTSSRHPRWTRQLILIDPAIHMLEVDRENVRQSQTASFDDPTEAAVRAEHPHWHPLDVELKVLATTQASRWAVEQTSIQNEEWDIRDAAAALAVPTHVIGADPAVFSIFTGDTAAGVLENPVVSMSVVAGAGHSPHRDKPEETIAMFMGALS